MSDNLLPICQHGKHISITASWGIQVFAAHTCRKKKKTQMQPQSLCAEQHFIHVYLHAQIAVHTHLTNHSYFDRGKTPNTPIEAHAGIKMA